MSVEAANAFISRWAKASPSERANSQLFLSELCDLLGVAHPDPSRDSGYGFEYEVMQHHRDGSSSRGRIDLYKRGFFVLESKQFQAAKAKASQLELAAWEAGLRAPGTRFTLDCISVLWGLYVKCTGVNFGP